MSNLKEQVNKTAALLNDIKSALEDQGVDTTNMVPRDYANAVRNIVNNITVENISLIPILIFQYSATRPTKPDGGNWNSETGEITLPDGWYSDISLDYESANKTEPLWMSNAVFSSSGEVYKTWSTPIRISGRDGVDGERGPAGLPGTTAGVTQFFNYPIFHIGTSVQPDTPNVIYDTIERELSIPDGWTETIERNDYNGVVWQSYLKYNTDNNPPAACTVPIRMTAESSVVTGNIRYYQLSDSRTVPNKGTSSWNIWTEDIDIAPTRTKPYLFCYDVTVYSESNRVSSPVYLMAIYTAGLLDIDVAYAVGRESTIRKGENESDEHYNERFGQFWFTSSEEAISADTEKEEHPDDGNFAYYPGLTENTLYLWCRETFEYEDHIDQFYRIISYYKAAEKAPVLYSAGVYNDLVHYTRNEDQCPYVFYPAGLYLDENENVETKTVDGETVPKTEEDAPTGTKYQYFFLKNSYENNESFDSFFEAYQNKKWKKIDSFEAIYSDIGIFKSALVGKFVFDEKYMFSQFGKGTRTKVDGEWTDWTENDTYKNYTDVRGSNTKNWITGEKYDRVGVAAAIEDENANGKFVPSACINAITGESWFAKQNAHFKSDGSWKLGSGDQSITCDENGNVTLGPDITISYGNVNGTDSVATKNDITNVIAQAKSDAAAAISKSVSKENLKSVIGDTYIATGTVIANNMIASELTGKTIKVTSGSSTIAEINGSTGNALFSYGKCKMNADGSGQLANGKIKWNKDGNVGLGCEPASGIALKIKGELDGVTGTFKKISLTGSDTNTLYIDSSGLYSSATNRGTANIGSGCSGAMLSLVGPSGALSCKDGGDNPVMYADNGTGECATFYGKSRFSISNDSSPIIIEKRTHNEYGVSTGTRSYTPMYAGPFVFLGDDGDPKSKTINLDDYGFLPGLTAFFGIKKNYKITLTSSKNISGKTQRTFEGPHFFVVQYTGTWNVLEELG